jgi:hypothetical protein
VSRQFNVFPSGNGIYQVEVPATGVKYVVSLTDELCDCKDFYEYQGPCTHAIATSRYQGSDPLALFNNRYTVPLRAFGAHIHTQSFLYQFYLHLYANNRDYHAQNGIAKGNGQGSGNNVLTA